MEIYEYLEQATAGIRLNARARQIRQELHTHLLFLADQFRMEGSDEGEAQLRAMQQLGNPDEIRRGFESAAHGFAGMTPLQRAMATLAVLGALFGLADPLSLVVTILAVAVFALDRATPTVRRNPLPAVGALWRRHVIVAAALLLAGLFVGSEPIWGAGVYSPWPGSPLLWGLGPLCAGVAAVIAIAWDLSRDTDATGTVACVAGATLGVVSLLSGLILWRLYPVSPSPFVDWFVQPGWAVDPFYLANVVLVHPAVFSALFFLGTLGLGGIIGFARTGRVSSSGRSRVVD